MTTDDRYDIHLEEKFGHLQLIDVAAEAAAHEPWFNQTLTSINDSVARLGVIEGEFHWHHHEREDEFFLVLDGRLDIELAGRATASLRRGQALVVPAGLRHRQVAPVRSVVLMIERAGVTATGD